MPQHSLSLPITTPYYSLGLLKLYYYYSLLLTIVRGVVRRGLCAGLCARIGLHNLHKGCALFFSLLFFSVKNSRKIKEKTYY